MSHLCLEVDMFLGVRCRCNASSFIERKRKRCTFSFSCVKEWGWRKGEGLCLVLRMFGKWTKTFLSVTILFDLNNQVIHVYIYIYMNFVYINYIFTLCPNNDYPSFRYWPQYINFDHLKIIILQLFSNLVLR